MLTFVVKGSMCNKSIHKYGYHNPSPELLTNSNLRLFVRFGMSLLTTLFLQN